MSSRDRILACLKSAPALPSAGARVLQLLQRPEFEVGEVAKAIESDPGMATNVLRLANTVSMGGSRTIGSIRQAVVRFGSKRLGQLVVEAMLGPMARKEIRGYDMPPGSLWAHSVAVSITVERLAAKWNIDKAEHAVTAALLHDIGKVILGTFAEIDATPILAFALERQLPFDEAERALLGIDHAEAGALLLEQWKLPACIVEVAHWHHRPEMATGDAGMVELVHLADAMCLTSGIGTGRDGLNYRPSPEVARKHHLGAAAVESVLCDVLEEFETRRALFSIE